MERAASLGHSITENMFARVRVPGKMCVSSRALHFHLWVTGSGCAGSGKAVVRSLCRIALVSEASVHAYAWKCHHACVFTEANVQGTERTPAFQTGLWLRLPEGPPVCLPGNRQHRLGDVYIDAKARSAGPPHPHICIHTLLQRSAIMLIATSSKTSNTDRTGNSSQLCFRQLWEFREKTTHCTNQCCGFIDYIFYFFLSQMLGREKNPIPPWLKHRLIPPWTFLAQCVFVYQNVSQDWLADLNGDGGWHQWTQSSIKHAQENKTPQYKLVLKIVMSNVKTKKQWCLPYIEDADCVFKDELTFKITWWPFWDDKYKY